MNLKRSDLIALNSIKEFIDNHYREEITIQRLSTISNLTPVRLQQAFKEIYGHPIYNYIIDIRMKRAASLLTATELSIKEIAWEVGYRRTKKFSPMFKSSYGLTPTEYRDQHTL